MTQTPPGLTPLKEVADRLGIPERRLRERHRQYTHVRIGKAIYLTDDQMESFIATYTVVPSTPQSSRDKALDQTRERLRRRATGRVRKAAA